MPKVSSFKCVRQKEGLKWAPLSIGPFGTTHLHVPEEHHCCTIPVDGLITRIMRVEQSTGL